MWNDNQIIVPVKKTFSEILSTREFVPISLNIDTATVFEVNKALEAKKVGRKRRPPWELWRLVGQCTVNPSLEINLLRRVINRFKTADQHLQQDRLDSDLGADINPGKLYIFFYVPIMSSAINSRAELSADAPVSDLPKPRSHKKGRRKRKRENVVDDEEEEDQKQKRRIRRRKRREKRKSRRKKKQEVEVEAEAEAEAEDVEFNPKDEEETSVVDPLEQVEVDFGDLSSEEEEEEMIIS